MDWILGQRTFMENWWMLDKIWNLVCRNALMSVSWFWQMCYDSVRCYQVNKGVIENFLFYLCNCSVNLKLF
jgi:hypothetical protein